MKVKPKNVKVFPGFFQSAPQLAANPFRSKAARLNQAASLFAGEDSAITPRSVSIAIKEATCVAPSYSNRPTRSSAISHDDMFARARLR